jgi:mannose-6-phosphate isomerase-like protein (cupin superfamily)
MVIRTTSLSATKTFQWSPKSEITAIKLWRYDRRKPTEQVEGGMPTIIDLTAEAAKLRMFHGRTPQTTFAERQGSSARLAPFRDGALLLGKSAGKGHWEIHPGDELVHILDGTRTLEIVSDDGPPKSFALCAGMIAVVPQGAWHRLYSSEGATVMSATPFPGENIDLDVDDPRTVERQPARGVAPRRKQPSLNEGEMESRTPSIIDLNAELAKLTMFRRTPSSTVADRKGSVAQLAAYRDGLLLAIKSSGKIIGNAISPATS